MLCTKFVNVRIQNVTSVVCCSYSTLYVEQTLQAHMLSVGYSVSHSGSYILRPFIKFFSPGSLKKKLYCSVKTWTILNHV
jgi:hypothetical protein